MLTTHLNNVPYSKFVFIEDSIENSAFKFLTYIIQGHLINCTSKIHYITFKGYFERTKTFHKHNNIVYHDLTSDSQGWLNMGNKKELPTLIRDLAESKSVLIIDSLSHAVIQYGFPIIYQMLHQLLKSSDIIRILTVYHADILEDSSTFSQYFQHLATLILKINTSFNENEGRITYTYKKSSGKVIRHIENYKFENEHLHTEPIKKLDPKLLVQENLNLISPENLTTFKISLEDKEKESRDKLILPYLPKDDLDQSQGGNIFYQFDGSDDWDEEDPDDDLDI